MTGAKHLIFATLCASLYGLSAHCDPVNNGYEYRPDANWVSSGKLPNGCDDNGFPASGVLALNTGDCLEFYGEPEARSHFELFIRSNGFSRVNRISKRADPRTSDGCGSQSTETNGTDTTWYFNPQSGQMLVVANNWKRFRGSSCPGHKDNERSYVKLLQMTGPQTVTLDVSKPW